MDPVIMLNRVVFPAPFGPIIPRISLSPSSKLTESTALRPPKFLQRVSTRSTLTTVASNAPGRALLGSTGLQGPTAQREQPGPEANHRGPSRVVDKRRSNIRAK